MYFLLSASFYSWYIFCISYKSLRQQTGAKDIFPNTLLYKTAVILQYLSEKSLISRPKCQRELSVNTVFYLLTLKIRISCRNQCFLYLIFYGRFLFFLFCMYFRAQKSLNCIFKSTLFLSSLFFGFSFKFLDLIMKKTMIFIYISSNRIQHEFFIYFFGCPVIETSKTVISLIFMTLFFSASFSSSYL